MRELQSEVRNFSSALPKSSGKLISHKMSNSEVMRMWSRIHPFGEESMPERGVHNRAENCILLSQNELKKNEETIGDMKTQNEKAIYG